MNGNSGRRGQMSRSVSMGSSDPRLRRAPQEALTDIDLKLPLKLTKEGQISIDLAGALTVNPDGTISINTSNGITTAPGSPLSIQLNIDDDSLEITPDKKVRSRPRFSQVKVDQRDVREVTGRNLAEVIDNETELTKRRGTANGYASLDATGKVPASQIPVVAIPATIRIFSVNDITYDDEVVRFENTSGAAVNSLSIGNSDAGNAVKLSTVGSDANIDINVAPQGSGKLRVNNSIVETQGNKGIANGYAGLDGSTLLSRSQLPIFTSALAGAVSASGGGTSNFLRADGTWAALGTISTQSASNVSITGGTVSGVKFTDYTEPKAAPAISSGTLTLDLNAAQVFDVSLNANITTLTISNTDATSNTINSFTLIFTMDGTARTVTWPAAVKWAGGAAPTLTSTNAKKDVLSFMSPDNGTTWLGFVGGQNF